MIALYVHPENAYSANTTTEMKGNVMKDALRILNLEDNTKDAELNQTMLSARWPRCELVRVDNRDDYLAALEQGNIDVILSDFTMPRARKIAANNAAGDIASYNLADLHAKARTIFVSSGDDLKLAQNMIDSQPGTAYAFAANDAAPAAIIDLGRSMNVNRISTFSTPGSGVVTFYVLSALPADNIGNPASVLRIDSPTLATFKTVGAGSDDGSGRVAVNFEETTGRYVMLVWAPSTQNANFSVAEVAVFGPPSNARLLAANTGGNNASDASKDKTVRDFEDTKDFSKEIPGEGPAEEQAPAEGPAPDLPRPPPFVFIPRVVPTSP